MTIAGWIVFGLIALVIVLVAIALWDVDGRLWTRIVIIAVALALIAGLYFGMNWYFTHTASGSRALIDQQSNFSNGMERTITIYTADGRVLAQYSGHIDMEANSGGYVKFDFEGKRYIYYNCFVESIGIIK